MYTCTHAHTYTGAHVHMHTLVHAHIQFLLGCEPPRAETLLFLFVHQVLPRPKRLCGAEQATGRVSHMKYTLLSSLSLNTFYVL